MKMQAIQPPSDTKLDNFVAMIHAAMPQGMTSGPALQRKRAIGAWLMRLGDWLPPELESRGLSCYKQGRGVVYQTTSVTAAVRKEEAAVKRKKDEAKMVATRPITPQEWRAVADHIATAGTLSSLDALRPFAQTPVFAAIWAHPNKLPPELERLGITIADIDGIRSYSGL